MGTQHVKEGRENGAGMWWCVCVHGMLEQAWPGGPTQGQGKENGGCAGEGILGWRYKVEVR